MSLEDFFPRFKSITFCDVKNWKELRLKGKFIKVVSKEDENQDQLISKFYYTFDIQDEETEDVIGIHQEDKSNLGSNFKKYLDAGFIVLERDDEDEDVLGYYDHVDFERDREI